MITGIWFHLMYQNDNYNKVVLQNQYEIVFWCLSGLLITSSIDNFDILCTTQFDST